MPGFFIGKPLVLYTRVEAADFWTMQQADILSSRNIEQFILHGNFEIEENWGLSQLADYLNELALVEAGVPYSELGIGRRRQESMPALISASGDQNRIVYNPDTLSNPSITPPGSFALLRLNGVMRSQDGLSSQGIQSMVQDLQAAYSNPNIDGILIEANTGGGESLAGTMLQSAIQESPKAVVVYAHLLASAGVRGTLPADEIIASGAGSEIGSIGTFITVNKNFASWYNNNYQDVYADKSGNKNLPFREFLKGNIDPLKANINRSNENFLQEVQSFRQLRGDVQHTLSGEMFSAKQARSRGLIDGIGSFQYAVNRLAANVKLRKTNH
jgi:ClpP class serine protease